MAPGQIIVQHSCLSRLSGGCRGSVFTCVSHEGGVTTHCLSYVDPQAQ